MRGPNALSFLLLTVGGWVNRRQLATIAYLLEENRVLREQLGCKRLRLTDAQRRRLAVKGKALGRARLKELGTIVTPDTILRWYRKLIAKKYDGSRSRGPGRRSKSDELRQLVVNMAKDNRTWGYTRIVGAMKNLGFTVARSTVAAILAEHGIAPAPEPPRSAQRRREKNGRGRGARREKRRGCVGLGRSSPRLGDRDERQQGATAGSLTRANELLVKPRQAAAQARSSDMWPTSRARLSGAHCDG